MPLYARAALGCHRSSAPLRAAEARVRLVLPGKEEVGLTVRDFRVGKYHKSTLYGDQAFRGPEVKGSSCDRWSRHAGLSYGVAAEVLALDKRASQAHCLLRCCRILCRRL